MRARLITRGGSQPLEIRRLFRELYMEGLGLATAEEIRNAIEGGRDATGRPLPAYASGDALESERVTLRRTGRLLDTLGPVRASDTGVVIASSAPYARYVHRRFQVIGITDTMLDRAQRMVQEALETSVERASVLSARQGRRRGRPVSRSRRRFR